MNVRRPPTLFAIGFALSQLVWLSTSAVAQEAVQSGQAISQLDLQRPEAVNDLNGHLARLAENPRDVSALIGAGEAALALDDPRAATGFFVRAEEIESGNGRIKAGLGHAMLDMQNPGEALRLFDQAMRLGYEEAEFLSDRGLAHDLTGDSSSAQRDYQSALRSRPNDTEIIRRYAVSLGISGQVDAAEKVIQPLLYKGDRAAWRDRAFIMAMNGRRDQARDIAVKTMPKQLADAIQPYMDRMQALTPAQRAAAVHFGNFPSDTGVKMAAAAPQPQASAASATPIGAGSDAKVQRQVAMDPAEERRLRKEERRHRRLAKKAADTSGLAAVSKAPVATVAPAPARSPIAKVPEQQVAAIPPQKTSPPITAPASITPAAQPAQTSSVPVQARPSSVQGPPAPEPSSTPTTLPPQQLAITPSEAREAAVVPVAIPAPNPLAIRTLADIMRELKVPETETQPTAAVDLGELDAIRAERRKARETIAEKAKRDAAAKAKAESDAKAKAEKARLANNPARSWVQVGTGRDVAALGFTMKGLRKKYDSLASRDAWTASWGKTNRLVVGPFSTFGKARDYEAQLKKGGADAFAWQSDPGEEVARMAK